MAKPVKLISTADYKTNGVKFLNYGPSGVGKTKLIATMDHPVIISAESGLLSLSDYDIPAIEINSMGDLVDAYKWLVGSTEGKAFPDIAVDSISDLGEVLLSDFKKVFKDGRQAYGKMGDEIADMIRKFRDLKGRNVYFIAKEKRIIDEGTGFVSFAPNLPGVTMMQNLPYFYDVVTAMQYGKAKDGKVPRVLQTAGNRTYVAKDRSDKLDLMEQPNLSKLIKKIKGEM